VAVTYSTPQLVSAGSNTATGNVTGLAGGKPLLVVAGCRNGTAPAPSTLTTGGVSAALVQVASVDATYSYGGATPRFISLYKISAAAAAGLSGTQSCTITWPGADRVVMWVTEMTGGDENFVDLAINNTNGASTTASGLTSTATGQSLFSFASRAGTITLVWDTSSADEIAEGGASGTIVGIGRTTLGAAGAYTSQWTATGGSAQIAVIGLIIAEASGGTTLSLTGSAQTITSAAGSVAPSATKALSGAAAGLVATAGSVSPSVAKSLTGAAGAIAAAPGQVSPSLAVGVTGASLGLASAAGSVSPTLTLGLTGAAQALALAAGSVSLDAGGSIALSLSGVALGVAMAAGTLAPALSRALTGSAAGIATQAGTVSPALSVGLTGSALGVTAAAGQVSPSLSLSLSGAGVTLNLAAGSVSVDGAQAQDPIPHLVATWTPGLVLSASHTPGLRLTATWSSTQ
jgi:hypothetical protein